MLLFHISIENSMFKKKLETEDLKFHTSEYLLNLL